MISKVNLLTAETTEQQIFDYVCEHLADQKSRCISETIARDVTIQSACRYRYKKKACAIGSLYPNEMYDPIMEGEDAEGLISKFFPDATHLIELSVRLQSDHDEARSLNALKDDLELTASQFDLDPSKIELIKEWEAL